MLANSSRNVYIDPLVMMPLDMTSLCGRISLMLILSYVEFSKDENVSNDGSYDIAISPFSASFGYIIIEYIEDIVPC